MGQWIVMTMEIAFANTDLMVVNVISVKRDSQAANVTNANRKSLVTIVINANQAISITHCVKVCKSSINGSRKRKEKKIVTLYVVCM